MPSWDFYLRLMTQANVEALVTPINVTGTAAQFSTYLTGGNTRKAISAYNNSDANSGELYYGFSSAVTPHNGMPIPKGAVQDIPIASGESIQLWFVADSGQQGDLRVEEYS